MVCCCTPLTHEEDGLVEDLVKDREQGRNKKLFKDFEEDWKEAVLNYAEHEGNPEEISPLNVSKKLKTALINLYLSPNKTAASIKSELSSHSLTYCPFCGETGRPNTLDHYLPKDVFPEFSISHSNLVPMCDKCQGKKLETYLNEDGSKAFLHPYFDIDDVVLFVEVEGEYDPIVKVKLVAESSNVAEELCNSHLKNLGVNSRFIQYFSTRYPNVVMGICKAYKGRGDSTEAEVRRYLEAVKLSSESEATNHWDAIIFRSLLKADDWINFIVEQARRV